MKQVTVTFLIFWATVNLYAQNVSIPDSSFNAYLINNSSINTNGDSFIQVQEATAFTGTIDCGYKNISDLTGIEAFTNLTKLYCYNNQLVSINITNNTALTELWFHNNQIDSIDLSTNTALTAIRSYNNNLSNIDISNNTALVELNTAGNQLLSLNTSANTALQKLSAQNNQIANLDLTTNTNLTRVACGGNQLSSLDLSNNSLLTYIFCSNNQLTSLNVANGNNSIITTFNAVNNPSLSCIEVDDVQYSTSNWTNIDSTSNFSTNCLTSIKKVDVVPTTKIFPNPVLDDLHINFDSPQSGALELYTIAGRKIFQKQINQENRIKLNMKNYTQDLYILKITDENGFYTTHKLIKSK